MEEMSETHCEIAFAGTSHWHADMHLDAARAAGAEIIGVWDEDPQARKRFRRATCWRVAAV